MTVLYTTHLMEEAEELSDRVGIIDHGDIIAMGTQGELTQQVGEEDRLLFSVGEQVVPDELLRQIESEVEGVTQAQYESIEIGAIPSSENGDAVEIDKRSTGTIAAIRSGQTSQGVVNILAKRGRKALPHVISMMDAAGIEIVSVEVREPDLEAVFLNLTGRALRD